jgi:hypothetical protein
MSILLLSLARENPWPGLAVASLNLMVALFLVALSLLVGVTVSVLIWLQALVDQEEAPVGQRAKPRATPACALVHAGKTPSFSQKATGFSSCQRNNF